MPAVLVEMEVLPQQVPVVMDYHIVFLVQQSLMLVVVAVVLKVMVMDHLIQDQVDQVAAEQVEQGNPALLVVQGP